MSATDINRWLDAIRFTPPFEIADAAALKEQIHAMLPGSIVDVYTTRWTQVRCRIAFGDVLIERVFDVA